LLILLLVVSVGATYYILGIGYIWAMNSFEVVNAARSFEITFEAGGKPESEALLEKIKEITAVECYCVYGKALTFRYYDITKRKNSDRIKIAAFYSAEDKYNVNIDTGTELLQNDTDIFFVDYFYGLKAGDTVFLGNNALKVSGTGLLQLPVTSNLVDISAYVPLCSFEKHTIETEKIFVFLASPPEIETVDAILSIIESVPGVAQVIPPNLSPVYKIDRLQLYMAIAIMLLSFINIYAGLSFFLKVRQREYYIYGLCGASPRYIFLDIACFTLLLSMVPYILGTVVYYIAALFLNRFGFTCIINPFISFVTLIILTACSLVIIYPLLKHQKMILTFS
jgi:hypothetical protein